MATKTAPDEMMLTVYADRLDEYPAEVLREVFVRAEKTCKFFPAIPELRDLAEQVKSDIAEAKRPKRCPDRAPEGTPWTTDEWQSAEHRRKFPKMYVGDPPSERVLAAMEYQEKQGYVL